MIGEVTNSPLTDSTVGNVNTLNQSTADRWSLTCIHRDIKLTCINKDTPVLSHKNRTSDIQCNVPVKIWIKIHHLYVHKNCHMYIYKLSNQAWKVLIVINIKNHLSFGEGQTNQVQTKENM